MTRRFALLGCLLLGCSRTASPSASPAEPPKPPRQAVRETEPDAGEVTDLVLPTRFVADRVFLHVRTAAGEPLRLFTDTGGGLYLHHHVAQRLDLVIETISGEGGQPLEVVALPELDAATPMPPLTVLDGRLPVARQAPFGDVFGDGMLGEGWFRDRVWTFDYAVQTLTLHQRAPECDDGSEVALGFPQHDGQRTASYPRIQVEVDGQVLDLLFDTGATVLLTEPGLRGLDDEGPAERATSFVVRSIFDRWRADHPDWRVIEGADRMAGDPMIEVPAVSIGTMRVGPVWFTARDDPNFHGFMSQWMDRRVEGALGGSALRFFRVTVDYPGARACLRLGESMPRPAAEYDRGR